MGKSKHNYYCWGKATIITAAGKRKKLLLLLGKSKYKLISKEPPQTFVPKPWYFGKPNGLIARVFWNKKSCIRETPNLSTDANICIDTEKK